MLQDHECFCCGYKGRSIQKRVGKERHDFCPKCGYDLTLQEALFGLMRQWRKRSRVFGPKAWLTGADSVIIHTNINVPYSTHLVNKYANLTDFIWNAVNEISRYTRFGVTGTFKGMSIYASSNTLNQTLRLMLRINSANTALFYDILAGVAPDVDVVADVPVTKGDHVNWMLQPLAVPNAGTMEYLSVCLWLRVP